VIRTGQEAESYSWHAEVHCSGSLFNLLRECSGSVLISSARSSVDVSDPGKAASIVVADRVLCSDDSLVNDSGGVFVALVFAAATSSSRCSLAQSLAFRMALASF
jgi:hypothetical protein